MEVIETKEEAQKRKESMFLAPTSKAPRPKTTFVEEDEEIPEPPDADNLLKWVQNWIFGERNNVQIPEPYIITLLFELLSPINFIL